MPIRKKLIQMKVEELLKKSEITTLPIPVEKIARTLGLEVKYEPLEGDLSGCIVRQGGKAIIGINSQQHENRQRFTLAHEIGHYLLHQEDDMFVDHAFKMNRKGSSTNGACSFVESEANCFAAELLMPTHFLQKDLQQGEIDVAGDSLIYRLSTRYKVSTQALTLRLVALGHL